jgi:Outer mitochondrial membrane transport complex protein
MALELYILPPLFSLPSISGSCIAALSLCNLSLDKSAFKVIESIDLSIGLPALKDGNAWHRGYTSIKTYVLTQNDIDSSLTPIQKADIVAWGSLIEDLGDTLAVPSRPNYV